MITSSDFMIKMADGTLKQVNPFNGTQVWTVPGRGHRPITSDDPAEGKKIDRDKEGEYCVFCEKNYLKTPPEKSRLIKNGNGYETLSFLSADKLNDTVAEFRRIPNLFEIISLEYWQKNYNYKLSKEAEERKNSYISNPAGREHVLEIINKKLKSSGMPQPLIEELSPEYKLYTAANSFFAGGHELIVAKGHFDKDVEYMTERLSSSHLSLEKHFQYTFFTIDALKDIFMNNRYVRYVTVFQNWLKPAGASFDHLHKQLVAVDGRSEATEREFRQVRLNPNLYNENAVNYAGYNNLIFAENDYAIAFADFGHRFPTLAIYSKSPKNQPWNHTKEEIRGMSDMIHACHAATGSDVPCNEEWLYRPPDVDVPVPWHILIKWRVNTPAGFEAVTKIYVNTIDPWLLRDIVVKRLFALRSEGKIAQMKLADECDCVPNCLQYNLNMYGRCTESDYLVQSRETIMTL